MTANRKSLADRCRGIELLVLDTDGVLTAGGIAYGDNGLELKTFHVRDGSAIKSWHRGGKQSAIISGRTSNALEKRTRELDIAHLVQGADDKLRAYRQLLNRLGLRADQACVVGDDSADVPVLCDCGLAIAVADACPEALSAAHYITRAGGGQGAVREVIGLLLGCQRP
jgi:3-deoxy-D-manno-octulosonate 8-phosphate phosphatase (KDO 8-P phosphatase)